MAAVDALLNEMVQDGTEMGLSHVQALSSVSRAADFELVQDDAKFGSSVEGHDIGKGRLRQEKGVLLVNTSSQTLFLNPSIVCQEDIVFTIIIFSNNMVNKYLTNGSDTSHGISQVSHALFGHALAGLSMLHNVHVGHRRAVAFRLDLLQRGLKEAVGHFISVAVAGWKVLQTDLFFKVALSFFWEKPSFASLLMTYS